MWVFPVQVVIKRKHVLGRSRDLRMIIAHASSVFTHAFPVIPSSFTDARLVTIFASQLVHHSGLQGWVRSVLQSVLDGPFSRSRHCLDIQFRYPCDRLACAVNERDVDGCWILRCTNDTKLASFKLMPRTHCSCSRILLSSYFAYWLTRGACMAGGALGWKTLMSKRARLKRPRILVH